MQYDISQASRLFGISPSGLRYYEEIGLIRPVYSPGGRRKYSERDLSGLMFLRTMRALGIGMEETREYFHYDNTRSAQETGRFMLCKVEEANERAQYYMMLARYLKNHGERLLNMEEGMHLRRETPPDYYLLALDPLFGKTKQEQQSVAKWIGIAPLSQICNVYVLGERGLVSRISGFAVRKSYADRIDLPLRERAQVIPGLPSVETVVQVRNKEGYGLDEEDLLPVCKEIGKTQGWREMRVVSKIFHTHLDEGVREKFYKIWVNCVT